jgi:hypothetical protein
VSASDGIAAPIAVRGGSDRKIALDAGPFHLNEQTRVRNATSPALATRSCISPTAEILFSPEGRSGGLGATMV